MDLQQLFPTKKQIIKGIVIGIILTFLVVPTITKIWNQYQLDVHNKEYRLWIFPSQIMYDEYEFMEKETKYYGGTILKLFDNTNLTFYVGVTNLMTKFTKPCIEDKEFFYSCNMPISYEINIENKSRTRWIIEFKNIGLKNLSNLRIEVLFLKTNIIEFNSTCEGSVYIQPDNKKLSFEVKKQNEWQSLLLKDSSCKLKLWTDSLELPQITAQTRENAYVELIEPGSFYIVFINNRTKSIEIDKLVEARKK